MTNSKKKILIIVTAIVILLVVSTLIINYASRVPKNDPTLVGNTASNLYNGGLFCEHDNKVFFANAYDSDSLYVMNSDESGVKKLLNVAVASINADDHRIYYSQTGKSGGKGLGYVRKTTGLFSCNYHGNKSICYTQNPIGVAILCGNNIYYQNYRKKVGTTIYSITTNKENNHEVIDQMINPSSIYNGTMFYGGVTSSHSLYTYTINTGIEESYWDHNVYNPTYYSDGCIYYIDPDTDYELHRYEPYNDADIALSTERIDMYNLYGNYAYYQVSTGDTPALHRVNLDGSDDVIIAEGIYKGLQSTSKYLYFTPFDFESDSVVYHVAHGSSTVSVFDPGIKK